MLKHLIRGRTAKEVAVIMHLSKRTVENNIARMKDKSGCKNKSELIDKYFDLLT